MPVYKPEPYFFRTCIESVLNQSWQNWELVVSDDSSTQEAGELLSQFKDERIRFFKNTGKKGIFPNLNHAIRQARGEFLQIFCQDDLMRVRLLEEQLNVLQKYPSAGFVYAQSDIINESGQIIEPCKYPGTPKKADMLIPQQKAFNYFFKYGCLPGNLSTVMMRRSLVTEVGDFKEEFSFGGDFKYWVDSIEKHDFAILLPPMVAVRRHKQQASRVLGIVKWTEDSVVIYRQLFEQVKIDMGWLRPRLFINERFGVQSFYGILAAACSEPKPALLKELLLLHRYPFNLWLIITFFVLTFGGRFKIFQLKEIQLFPK